MVLRPPKFNYKNIFKRRRFRRATYNKLQYGQFGLLLLQPLQLTSRHIFRHKIFLKKAVRKSDKTTRKVWFNAFPFLPLSRKVEGSRMGKGTGKLAGWVADLPSGINILEFKNLRTGRANYYCRQVKLKVAAKSKIVWLYDTKVSLPFTSSRKVRYMSLL